MQSLLQLLRFVITCTVAAKEAQKKAMKSGQQSLTVTLLLVPLLMLFAIHCTWVTSSAYSSPSVVLASQVCL